ncbi:30S ribosomal protein S17 [bacterium]|nr:30S ribosomal protein S17 [bacterium]
MTERNHRKVREGVVVSDKMDKTLVVRIDRTVRHPLYDKFVTRSKKVHVHDAVGEAKEGDLVRIMETRPLSKTKRWRYLETVRKAQ